MVERTPIADFLTHAILIAGAMLVALPVYLAFVASTLTPEQIMDAPMTLLPGSQFVHNYSHVLTQGSTPLRQLMFNSAVSALIIATGKITIPLLASATATFLFRQFFLSIPEELAEAARIDGAGPMRFFWSILLPLARTQIAALFVILFIYGWNQYLWPLIITTREDYYTAVIGIKRLISNDVATEWHLVMTTSILAMLPPALVVVLMQRWFVKGLVETEK